jgi:hypothetical protein
MQEVVINLVPGGNGLALDCGHFLPEEDPERTTAELIRFLS